MGILIEGQRFLVPVGETLLACIQDIVKVEFPVLGRFCWNNECGNCELSVKWIEALVPVQARGCQTVVEEGMELADLTPELSYYLRHKLR